MPGLTRKDARKLQASLEGVPENSDIDQPLSGPEDSSLNEEQINLQYFATPQYVRPANVDSLRAWGQETLPSGKRKGLTFKESFDKDMPYAAYMARKTTLTSAWARSYQNFAVAMFKSMARAKLEKASQAQQEKQNPNKNKRSKVTGKGGYPETKETTDPTLDDDGWKLCPMDGSMAASSSTTGPMPRARSAKRHTEPNTTMVMKDDLTADQRLEIMTRKALLRRELERLEQLEPTLGKTEK